MLSNLRLKIRDTMLKVVTVRNLVVSRNTVSVTRVELSVLTCVSVKDAKTVMEEKRKMIRMKFYYRDKRT